MHKLYTTYVFPILLCIFLLALSFPVQAQTDTSIEQTETKSSTPENPATSTAESLPTETPILLTLETPSPAAQSETLSLDTPSETSTTDATASQNIENTPTGTSASFTATPTSVSPTATSTSKSSSSCDLDDIYKRQITIIYDTSSMPKPSVNYSLIEDFTNGDGTTTSVIQVSKENYCQALKDLQHNKKVINAEPNYSISLLETTPNDPYLNRQYYLDNIRALRGWDYTTGSAAVTIAILDTGVDLTHEDLAGKLVSGYDFVYNDDVPQDENGHGTIVAGIAAAISNNGTGVAGVSWGAQIMPLRVLDASGNGSYTTLAEAIIWATDNGARVINMSVGGTKYSETLELAVNYAVDKGVILVAATGNSGSSTVLYPAALSGVIGVGATDSSNKLASFSNTGNGVDVVAPGVSIYSTYLGGSYRYSSGTSMSSPQVAGFAALLASLPELPYSSQIVNLIQSSAKDLGASGYDSKYGHGLIQIGPAIRSIYEEETPVTSDEQSKKRTPTPTETLYTSEFFFIPTEFPSESLPGMGTDANFTTPTPGEVFMLQDSTATLTASSTATEEIFIKPTLPEIQRTPANENKIEKQSSFLLIIGVLYILLGIGLFVYIRKYSR